MPPIVEETESPVSEELWPGSSFEEIFLEHYGHIVAALYRLLGDRSRALQKLDA